MSSQSKILLQWRNLIDPSANKISSMMLENCGKCGKFGESWLTSRLDTSRIETHLVTKIMIYSTMSYSYYNVLYYFWDVPREGGGTRLIWITHIIIKTSIQFWFGKWYCLSCFHHYFSIYWEFFPKYFCWFSKNVVGENADISKSSHGNVTNHTIFWKICFYRKHSNRKSTISSTYTLHFGPATMSPGPIRSLPLVGWLVG